MTPTRLTKNDADNGLKAICRVSSVLRSPLPGLNRTAKI